VIVTLVLFGVLVVVWGWCQHRRLRHEAAVAWFDRREAKLHADVDVLLYGLTDMEHARAYMEDEAA
jgi:hypothetical protein